LGDIGRDQLAFFSHGSWVAGQPKLGYVGISAVMVHLVARVPDNDKPVGQLASKAWRMFATRILLSCTRSRARGRPRQCPLAPVRLDQAALACRRASLPEPLGRAVPVVRNPRCLNLAVQSCFWRASGPFPSPDRSTSSRQRSRVWSVARPCISPDTRRSAEALESLSPPVEGSATFADLELKRLSARMTGRQLILVCDRHQYA